ncbi:aminoacyl-tRNA hydrolase [Candidatus Riesia pediculicola]|uniref:aminoacyl-tRNA hydrolase n=1 Tax=Candidatus Riesia pediculicola TaxID=401619 RepID=UPI0009B76DD4|nr:aminoacyl-tRNA hydrolase [Candidatus Riesia pediculicola]ARC53923.1 hypothetical protein AOE55_02075 [Candidatus Riesia pediculicola]
MRANCLFKLIAGLSNPKRYSGTRHNVGELFVKFFSKKFGNKLVQNKKFFGKIDKLSFLNSKVFLLVSDLYMNNNGIAISHFCNFYHICPKKILVVHDELDLPPGSLRIKIGGSYNGHKGVLSVEEKLGSSEFYRLRIGIGRPYKNQKVSEFVLNFPDRLDRELISLAINRASSYLYSAIQKDICFSKIQNYINSINYKF